LPFLFIAWANIHGGMIVGLVLLALFLLGRLMPWIWRVGAKAPADELRRLPSAGTATILLAAALVAGLGNPFLHRVYAVPFQLTTLIESGVFHNLEWIRPPWPATWLYHLALLVALLVIGMRLRRPVWSAIFPLLFLAAISWQYVRNIALFGMLAPLLLVRVWGVERPSREDGEAPSVSGLLFGRGPVPWAAASLFLVLGLFLLFGNHRFTSGLGVDPLRVPRRAVDFVERERLPGNLFNAYVFGGYIAWRLHPGTPIFIDGRNEVFAELGRELVQARTDSRRWSALLEHHDIGHAILEYAPTLEQTTIVDPGGGAPRVVERPSSYNKFPRSRWALVFWDDTAMVLVRRDRALPALITAHEYRHVFPENAAVQLELIAAGEADAAGCLRELRRKLDEDPDCRRAADLLVALEANLRPSP
jgi:hypothetical protein